MRFDVITLFPTCFDGLAVSNIWKKAQETKKIELHLLQLRDFSTDKHKAVDDTPYGGGAGMLLRLEPLVACLESIERLPRSKVVMMSPQGPKWTQKEAIETQSSLDQLILVCGRYEGVDERFIQGWVDQCISVGDYVLSGGELAAMVVMESLSRLIPGVLGDQASVDTDSLQAGGLKYPQYTKPRTFQGLEVPEVLLSGDHAKIKLWREKQANIRTLQTRPDLLKEANILPHKNAGKIHKE